MVITGTSLFFLLPFGIWFYLRDTIDLPALLLCLMLGSGYMVPLVKLSAMGSLLSIINEGVRRVDKIFSEPEIPEPDTPKIPENYDIEFKNVSFSYREKEVLHDISFKAKEETVTALVGPSGAGKTTIANLTARFWDVDSGEILIGGHNIKELKTEGLLSYISMVFQDVYLFNDTVFNNIKIGKKILQEKKWLRQQRLHSAMSLLRSYSTDTTLSLEKVEQHYLVENNSVYPLLVLY